MGRKIVFRPSVVEYGDLTIGPNGTMDGSFKRAYTFVATDGSWVLIKGFKIGTLVTEWFSQVQTAPTLIGYIEGAPPVPVENWTSKDDAGDDPLSSIKFVNAQSCSYSYSSSREDGSDKETEIIHGGGAKWEASAGLGFSTQISEGEIKAQPGLWWHTKCDQTRTYPKTVILFRSKSIHITQTRDVSMGRAGHKHCQAGHAVTRPTTNRLKHMPSETRLEELKNS
jgi:hypothetical protein